MHSLARKATVPRKVQAGLEEPWNSALIIGLQREVLCAGGPKDFFVGFPDPDPSVPPHSNSARSGIRGIPHETRLAQDNHTSPVLREEHGGNLVTGHVASGVQVARL
jgi:hypothetical protein